MIRKSTRVLLVPLVAAMLWLSALGGNVSYADPPSTVGSGWNMGPSQPLVIWCTKC